MANQLSDKVSYIRGMMEGMQFNADSNEGKLLIKIVELLGEMADEVEVIGEAQDELGDYVDDIDEDLADLEDALFGDEDDEDIDFDDDDMFDDEDGFEDEDDFEDDEDDEPEEGIFVECICEKCKGSFYVREDELSPAAKHVCPHCGAHVHAVPSYEADVEIPVAHLEDEDE